MSGNFNPSKASQTDPKEKNRWATQWHCFQDAQRMYGREFKWDVCAEKPTSKVGDKYFGPDNANDTRRDALQRVWPNDYWCNPPFDDKLAFIDHALKQQAEGRSGMLLVPYEPCAIWFQERFGKGCIIYEPNGRYNFYEPDGVTAKSDVNFPVCFVCLPSHHFGDSIRVPFKKTLLRRKKKVAV